jgi:hypothetical protein
MQDKKIMKITSRDVPRAGSLRDIFRRSLHDALRRLETMKTRYVVTTIVVTTWLFSEESFMSQ